MEILHKLIRFVKQYTFSFTYYLSLLFGILWLFSDRVAQGLSVILLAIIASELIKLRRATSMEDVPGSH